MKPMEVIIMAVIFVLLLIGATVCFGLAAAGVNVGRRVEIHLVAFGLLLVTLVPIIQRLRDLAN